MGLTNSQPLARTRDTTAHQEADTVLAGQKEQHRSQDRHVRENPQQQHSQQQQQNGVRSILQQQHLHQEQAQLEQMPRYGVVEEEPEQICTSDTHTSPLPTRFVGDLNPQARLIRGNAASLDDEEELAPGEVGVWLQAQARPCSKCGCRPDRRSPSTTISPISRGLRPAASDLVSYETIKVLSDLYFANIHPVLPLLNEEEYWQSLSGGTIPLSLVHVVCLTAAKDHAAEKELRLLHSEDKVLPVRDFCSRLYMSVSKELSQRTGMKKLTLMRILGLLSMHHEGADGADQASSCISQAINHAQALALHLPRPIDVDAELKRTFWCLWTLDRLNAATRAGPCNMSDVDIAVAELTPKESGSVAFDVWFRISKMLNSVIDVYRPKREEPISGWDTDFPGFEQIMDEMQAWKLSSSTIGS